MPGLDFPGSEEVTDWIAEGLIVAPALPSGAVIIGDCEVHPSPMTWSERQEPMQTIGSGPGIYSTMIPEPAHLKFSASHRITTKVNGVIFEVARNIAIQRFSRVASLALLLFGHLGFAPEAAVRLAAMAPADDPSNRVGDLVEARGGAMPVMPMDGGLLSLVDAMYEMAKIDGRLGRLIDVWHEADVRAGLAFTVDDWQDVVIRFSKILEGVGEAMRPERQALEEAGRAERESAVRDLTALLVGQPRLEVAVSAIRKAHSTIRLTGLEGVRAKIESAGLVLGLYRTQIDLATRVYSIRSAEGLAHFGSGEMKRSDVNDARTAARAYLTAYLRQAHSAIRPDGHK